MPPLDAAADKDKKPPADCNNKPAALNKSSAGAGAGADKGGGANKKRTPFFLFCTEKRGEVREAHPDTAITEQVRVCLGGWGEVGACKLHASCKRRLSSSV